MKEICYFLCLILMTGLFSIPSPAQAQAMIIDHTCTDIRLIPEAAIQQAKNTLHIGYGHTSHGSQITTGMTGLTPFANNGGLGLSLPEDIFAWNNGGTDGALDLEEGDGYGSGWLDHDCGYYPAWVNETRNYLNDPTHADVNVIIWSWCGQVSGRTEQGMIDTYLAPMSQLETEYPNVKFVYMTGHADGTGETGNLHLRNQQIRDYCVQNNKVLYDFYDIECYDPDGNYFGDKNVEDNCDYTGGNWAIEWQETHTQGLDWYDCASAHSQPLNANQKAYAAWWLWAVLAGWNAPVPVEMYHFSATQLNAQEIKITWQTASEINCVGFHVWRSEQENHDYKRVTNTLIPGQLNASTLHEYSFIDRQVRPGKTYWYKIEDISTEGQSEFSEAISIRLDTPLPGSFNLRQNYPNPFNSQTRIAFYLPEPTRIRLEIINSRGKMVRVLENDFKLAGSHKTFWDGKHENGQSLASGIYICRLQAGREIQSRKMLFMQ